MALSGALQKGPICTKSSTLKKILLFVHMIRGKMMSDLKPKP